MARYCDGCNRVVGVRKKKFSGWCLIFTCGFYAIYRILFVRKNKCQICGIKTRRKK